MSEGQIRAELLRKLIGLAERLPNGLLHRLVEDALFFHEWNLGKKKARATARLSQYKTQMRNAEKRYWKDVERRRA